MSSVPPLNVKARMLPVQRLIIEDTNLDRVSERLSVTLAQAPALFRQAPIALDLTQISSDLSENWLSRLLQLARQSQLVVFALAGPKDPLNDWCLHFNLAWLDEKVRAARPEKTATTLDTHVMTTLDTHVITQPVRSGQQVYARGANLLIMSQVSAGAEVIADGSIHIFGTLRGRAMAGVQGLESAEIVCQQMDADLVAIAGTYRVRDDIADSEQGAARVYLKDEQLNIERF